MVRTSTRMSIRAFLMVRIKSSSGRLLCPIEKIVLSGFGIMYKGILVDEPANARVSLCVVF